MGQLIVIVTKVSKSKPIIAKVAFIEFVVVEQHIEEPSIVTSTMVVVFIKAIEQPISTCTITKVFVAVERAVVIVAELAGQIVEQVELAKLVVVAYFSFVVVVMHTSIVTFEETFAITVSSNSTELIK